MTRISPVIRSIACFFFVAPGAWSQTAQITGAVTDPSGAAVTNTQVIATNTETGVSRSSITNDAGNYLITGLFPGPYQISRHPPVLSRCGEKP